jgi:hypothetical protein
LILKKWKRTTSGLGTKAEKQQKKIVSCYAKTTTDENRDDEGDFTTQEERGSGCGCGGGINPLPPSGYSPFAGGELFAFFP